MFNPFRNLRKPTNIEVVLFVFSLIVTGGSYKLSEIYANKLKVSNENFTSLEQRLITKDEIVIKRQEGNDTVRYIVKPQTEKQILQYVPVIDSTTIKQEEK